MNDAEPHDVARDNACSFAASKLPALGYKDVFVEPTIKSNCGCVVAKLGNEAFSIIVLPILHGTTSAPLLTPADILARHALIAHKHSILYATVLMNQDFTSASQDLVLSEQLP